MGVHPRLGDTVTLHYRLVCAGQLIVDTFHGEPESFVLGHGDIDPRLETLILTLTPGPRHIFDLAPWQAFGERDAALVQDLPRGDFPSDAPLAPGHTAEFPLPNGELISGTILELETDKVRVDFNHPLAGLPLHFEVELLSVTQNTP